MTNKRIFIFASAILVLSMILNLIGCTKISASDLMEGITPNNVESVAITDEHKDAYANFALELVKKVASGEGNTLVSPLSVYFALAMTANGALGDTKAEMENVLGLSTEQLNLFLHSYLTESAKDKHSTLHIANSIWFKDSKQFSVNLNFLQTNADYYGAGAFKAPFDDSTLRDINKWTEDNTDGMIEEVLDKISKDAVMYLVNALAFDAEWADIYEEKDVKDGIFTSASGEKQNVEMLHSTESRYLEDENAVGFIKRYASSYSFAALLPKEEMSPEEYLDTLTAEDFATLLTNAQRTTVKTAMPKFEAEFSTELGEVLCEMGMSLAFDLVKADFSELGDFSDEDNVCISRVLHKTFISVDEKGTKAGAATVLEMELKASEDIFDSKSVILDRPFVYMIIDNITNMPIFIGVANSIK